MAENWQVMFSAVASAIAAAASAVAAFWSARTSVRAMQLQMQPSISIAFDSAIESRDPDRKAVVMNESACPVIDLHIEVTNPADSDPRVMKVVGSYDLRRWRIPKQIQRPIRRSERIEVDCDEWFVHAREIIFIKGIPDEEKARRCQIIIETRCRRAADQKPFRFTYVYQVMTVSDRTMAMPVHSDNPADEGKQLILRRKAVDD